MVEDIVFNKFVTKGINIEKDDARTFSGHISAEIVDKQNEFVTQGEIMKTMDSWLSCGAPITDAHSNRIVGKGLEYEKSEYEGTPTVKIKAEIYKAYKLHDDVWKEIKNHTRKGLSIGGSSKTGRQAIIKDGRPTFELKDLDIYEVAVCKSPANSLAIIDDVNAFAKSFEMATETRGERNIIQCDTIDCVIKSNTEVEEAINVIQKFAGLGDRTNVSNTNLANQDPPNNAEPPKQTTKYIKDKMVKYDMTEDKTEDKETKPTEDKKEDKDSDIIKLLTQNISTQNERLAKQDTILEGIQKSVEDLAKQNPAGEGKTDSTSPPAATGKESGAKTKLETSAYQSESEQSGINNDSGSPPVKDKLHLNKEDDEDKKKEQITEESKTEEKKEDKPMEKSLQEPGTDSPNEIIKMSNGYEFVKTKSPRPEALGLTDYSQTMTGYDIYKAVENGWGGKFASYEAGLKEMNHLYSKGAFGTGSPSGDAN